MTNKFEAMEAWLKANPGKTTKDYLLEVRCPDDATRNAVVRLLDTLDANNIRYALFVALVNYTRKYQLAPLNEVESVVFDIMIAPKIGNNSYLIEVDMPDTVLGMQIENKSKTDSIPEEAFIWLLNQWFPDFNIKAINDKDRRKLMWADMGGLLGKVIGNRGFPNWKDETFANQVVAKFKADKSFSQRIHRAIRRVMLKLNHLMH